VRVLPPGGIWESNWSMEAFDTRDGVAGVMKEIASLQAQAPRKIHRTPLARFSPA
jgi:hypothetical protein